MSIRSVCVFCGARDGVGNKYAQPGKTRMQELSDVFVALPGVAGTLDELSKLWTSPTWDFIGTRSAY